MFLFLRKKFQTTLLASIILCPHSYLFIITVLQRFFARYLLKVISLLFIECALAFDKHLHLYEGIGPEVTDSCEHPCGCWELNPHHWVEHPVLFTNNLSLQHPARYLFNMHTDTLFFLCAHHSSFWSYVLQYDTHFFKIILPSSP